MANKIAIGGDHAGFTYKAMLKTVLEELGHTIQDFGPDSDASVDYPDHVHPLAKAVVNKEADLGVLICGSGNGVAITANKHQGVRAALCWQPEIAALARSHNNANVLCIPARFVSEEVAKEMLRVFLETEFEGGRHQNRVNKIAAC
ncbi:ribose 5-phosphate isomerase B [Pontibacter harenae]|uniref:ribose 5-phosphate isomerase B n=1 Tax=Pontibacter harenae TaxID=2894083 RepID=UPI001E34A41F|nr:ribose 5-phosphate isomerase B [Pontibacter harenae]MCC9165424.1 ribose 5-phosphate isomerase B [Pontibacter harenae]